MITFQKKLFLLIATLFSFNFLMADPCAMPENTISLDNGDVWYNVNTDIAGFQFEVDGTTVSGASGGDAASAGFTVSAGGSTVLGFSFTGSSIPAGCGTLTQMTLAGDATALSGIVFSDNLGAQVDVTYYEVPSDVPGCTDELACNYDETATSDDGSCTYIGADECDCDGNVEDCLGYCGGTAVYDECHVCNGSGINPPFCDCGGNVVKCDRNIVKCCKCCFCLIL